MGEAIAPQQPRVLRLHEKRALVTGGARGIGRAVANRFAAEGAKVVIGDVQHTPGNDLTGCYKVTVDVANESSVKSMIKETVGWLGGIDILVNCAGISIHRHLIETELADWQRILGINLTGTFLCNREVARIMCTQKTGCIINIASVAAFLPGARTHAYVATKGGVVSFTRAIAGDLAAHGIRVNAISPGPIETELVQKVHTAEFRAGYLARLPMGRYGLPDEIASVAVFLASDDASYMTGVVLNVDGGFSSAGIRV
jgi:3-oxoacyl-[acyl-carrier protein] reductase